MAVALLDFLIVPDMSKRTSSIEDLNLDKVRVMMPELKLPPRRHFSTIMSAVMQQDVVIGDILEFIGVLMMELIS